METANKRAREARATFGRRIGPWGSLAAWLAFGVIAPLIPLSAYAEPAREALVIGNGTYATLPPLPGCLLSAHTVAAALHNLGFNITEREDASSGSTDAAIGEFARHLAAQPGAAGVVYICAYATNYNDRPFLLPVTANIARPADVLTQGVLAKTTQDALARGGIGAGLLVLDTVPVPSAPASLGLDTLPQTDKPAGMGWIAATQAKPPDAVTPLAVALAASLKGPAVQVGPLLTTMQQQLGTNRTATLAALHLPAADSYLAGAPAPPPPPPAPAPVPTASPQPSPQAAAPQAALPADEEMTEPDRRRVQSALIRLGYYAGQVDGIFGPDTRAAIRRYQHELRATMTGRLTAEQASKLAGGS